MPDLPLWSRSAVELAQGLAAGDYSSRELAESVIARTDAVEPHVGAFLSRDADDLREQAVASDERRTRGEALGPLDGMPVAIKDVLAVTGQPLTCASKMLERFVSPYDAGAIERLKQAGALLWGRLNMDEFAMGSSTENSAFQPTANPWDTSRVPGGSSGGSAAAIAAGEAPLTLGSDTGGSIRQPAAFCGVVGIKPTYGRISRWGLVAFASSLDQVGPLGRTVGDVALLLEAICGHDARDTTSLPEPVPPFVEESRREVRPRVGIPALPEGAMGEGVDCWKASCEELSRSLGWDLVEVSVPLMEASIPVYYILATAEASSNLARYDGVRYTHRTAQPEDAIDLYFKSRGEGFGAEVKRRIILGTYVLSSGYYDAYYKRAQQVRTLMREQFLGALKDCDVLCLPTTPGPAWKRGELIDDPLSVYLQDIFTIPANLTGLPAISVPAGYSAEGLPLGIQFMGRPLREGNLLAVARTWEQHRRSVDPEAALRQAKLT